MKTPIQKIIKHLESLEQEKVNVSDMIFQLSLSIKEEKQVIIEAWEKGVKAEYTDLDYCQETLGNIKKEAEQYYKETFKN